LATRERERERDGGREREGGEGGRDLNFTDDEMNSFTENLCVISHGESVVGNEF
jgi:hypothetical protein